MTKTTPPKGNHLHTCPCGEVWEHIMSDGENELCAEPDNNDCEECEGGEETPMSTMEFINGWAEVMRGKAAENFTNIGSLMPVAMFYNMDGNMTILPLPEGMNSDRHKDVSAELIRVIAEKDKALAVLFMSEAWTSSPIKGTRFVQPSKDPKRREILMATLDTGIGTTLWMAEIKRGGDEPFVEPWHKLEGEKLSGRFTHFLPKIDENGNVQ